MLSADAAAQVTDTYDYDAYGGLFAQTGSSVNDYRYAGEQYVPGLGGYYLRARYYQPEVGRFLARDEFDGFDREPLSLNNYLFGDANPVMHVDASGRFSILAVCAAVSASDVLSAYGQRIQFGETPAASHG